MNDDINPGTPKTDELARNAAIRALFDRFTSDWETGAENATAVADVVTSTHSVTWERDVNANGVPVRRYVMLGEWEVDPEAAAQKRAEPAPVRVGDVATAPSLTDYARGDVVRYADRRDGGREWTVCGPTKPANLAQYLKLTSPGDGEFAETVLLVPTNQVELVRRGKR